MKEMQVEWSNVGRSLVCSKNCYYHNNSFPASARFLHFPADPEESTTKTSRLPNLNKIEFDHALMYAELHAMKILD